ncbi:hypothetical protein ACB265_10260, partial [Aeromonas dhakensis]
MRQALLMHRRTAVKYESSRISGNKKARSDERASSIGCLAVSYSRMANATLPSALQRFTSEFGMGSGG